MNLNISHIAGLCLDTLRLLNRPSTFFWNNFVPGLIEGNCRVV